MKEQSRTIRVKKQDQYKNKKKDNVILQKNLRTTKNNNPN